MAVVGAYARIDPESRDIAAGMLAALTGVETFSLEDPDKVGILIEADDLDAAHTILNRDLKKIEGVWAVWPVYVHDESGFDEAREAVIKTVV